MTISIVAIPEGRGRITERSLLWDQLLEAQQRGVALRIDELDAIEAKRIVNAMSHRVRKQLPSYKLRTRWLKREGALLVWIQN